jgi:hypothetical protein
VGCHGDKTKRGHFQNDEWSKEIAKAEMHFSILN